MASHANYTYYTKPYEVNTKKYRPPVTTEYPKNSWEDKLKAGRAATAGDPRGKAIVLRERWLDSMTTGDNKHIFLMNAARSGVDQRNMRNKWRFQN